MSSGKIGKYEYVTGGEISTIQKIKKKKAKLKQIDALYVLKPKELKAIEGKSNHYEKHLKYKEVFDELSNERIGEIYNTS